MKLKPKRIYLLFIFILPLFAQAQGVEGELAKNQFRIDFLLPGLAYERAINKNMSLVIDSHLGATSINNKAGNDEKIIAMQLVSLQYRYYLNLKNRHAKGKNTLTNSGLYTGFIAEQAIFYGQSKSTLLSKAAVGSGWQKTFRKGFNINIFGGAGYTDGITIKAKIRPTINLSLGIVLGAKKKYRASLTQ